MARTPREASLRYVHTLFNVGTFGEQADGELLARFVAGRGEAAELAFAALVERHGSMVLRVCRVILRDEHEAWDAFQATFVVLARRAGTLWVRGSLGPWLHQVARRVATCARSASARRRLHEGKAAERAARVIHERAPDDLGSALCEEVDRLPDAYRAAVVTCLLEGLTPEQASRRLGWPVGTVQSRLARGRDRLKQRLTRRGLAPSCALAGMVAAGSAPEGGMPVPLLESTLRVAVGFGEDAGMVPAAMEALVKGACNMMLMSQGKRAAVALLTIALVATGAAVVAKQQAGRARGDDDLRVDGAGEFVEREMARLDLELLAEEVRSLREQVESELRRKHKSELGSYDSEEAESARASYEAARKAYLASALRLKREQQRWDSSGPGLPDHEPNIARVSEPGPTEELPPTGSRSPASGIGSIDMDAVFKRYEGAKLARERFTKDADIEKRRLEPLQEELRDSAAKLGRLTPGEPDYKKLADAITKLQAKLEEQRSRAQRNFAQRETEVLSDLLKEVRSAIATVAEARGLSYVVKVHHRSTDLNATSIQDALGQAVVYSDPRSDITEEVIRELNRRRRPDQ